MPLFLFMWHLGFCFAIKALSSIEFAGGGQIFPTTCMLVADFMKNEIR